MSTALNHPFDDDPHLIQAKVAQDDLYKLWAVCSEQIVNHKTEFPPPEYKKTEGYARLKKYMWKRSPEEPEYNLDPDQVEKMMHTLHKIQKAVHQSDIFMLYDANSLIEDLI